MEGTIGEIKLFAGNFAPRHWMYCHGQLLPISNHSALYSIFGTTYGGDGRTTFALPDLRGRVPLGAGHGPGLTDRSIGNKGGSETNTLYTEHLPVQSKEDIIQNQSRTGRVLNFTAKRTSVSLSKKKGSIPADLDAEYAGKHKSTNNMQPWLAMNYIICIEGIYPSRS